MILVNLGKWETLQEVDIHQNPLTHYLYSLGRYGKGYCEIISHMIRTEKCISIVPNINFVC